MLNAVTKRALVLVLMGLCLAGCAVPGARINQPDSPVPSAPPPLEAYLTRQEQQCQAEANFIGLIIRAREEGKPLTWIRAVLRKSGERSPPHRQEVLSYWLPLADVIYADPRRWGPTAPQLWEYLCLHPD
jgi:hypothetical protein